MKYRIICCCLLILLSSCGSLFDIFETYDRDAYREGLDTGDLINTGSLIGRWFAKAIAEAKPPIPPPITPIFLFNSVIKLQTKTPRD